MTMDPQPGSACWDPTKTAQEVPKENDKALKVSTWPQNSPDPHQIEHPWDVPEKLFLEDPLCNRLGFSTCQDTVT